VTAVCRKCDHGITFAIVVDGDTRVPTGKKMPLDDVLLDRDDERANVAVYRNGQQQLVARVLKKDEQPDRHERRMMPHFATCKPVNVANRTVKRIRRSTQLDEGTLDLPGGDADVIPFPRR
jgi:hypothetical protein